MKNEKDDLQRMSDMPSASSGNRSNERTIKHETIPGQKPAVDSENQRSQKDKASHSTTDEDLN